ncbi:hypothetical protein LX64_02943 [Chitinophaga skermanii]|uniref:Uncharacterized protein n=1 Tax=Chitinophaga skermanii TaxID=331697 RepID=A0A327QHH7_9BACT|nr:hypothetical protein [Chitinophaga skermanii]RAJ04066.1 hypothetical protein LX64_02943 [Chitinophaga skermanii]
MTNERVAKFQEFLNKSLLIDQTVLIDNILDGNKEDLHIHNAEEFTIKFSSGRTQVATLALLTEYIEDHEDILSRKKADRVVDNSEQLQQSIEKLESDIKALKSAVADNRYIFYWLLVPYWLAKELINFDQVVLDYMGNHYWGITQIAGDHTADEILNLLFEELI